MNWADFYLACFAIGFLLRAVSFIAGELHWHLPHFPDGGHFGGGDFGGGDAPVVHGGGDAPVTHGGASDNTSGHSGSHTSVSPYNFVTVTAFLAWFGGTGFLITRFSSIWFALGFLIAIAAGIVGAGIVFLFLSRVLVSREENMDSADYEMVGVLGRISMPIRENGTGEIIYSQAGTRRTCGARSENGAAIEKGAEIVVTQYDKGIAYVRLWEEMNGEEPAPLS
jgi:membrane protein implicated in regulation of membrane protease activity